jgi:hypothetical protein
MKNNSLEGHSGCKLFLLKSESSDHIEGVRKFSKDKEYNKRLKAQSKKQSEFNSKHFLVPRVIHEGEVDGIYYFDMEYIRGATLSSSIMQLNASEIENIANKITNFIQENATKNLNESNFENLVAKKLDTIEKSIKSDDRRNILKNSFSYLKRFPWKDIDSSKCHGDLTLENILITENEIYIIDFLDTFFETWISDISKILQDLIVGWSFRNKIINDQITEHEKIKMHLFKDIFCKNINNISNKINFWEQVHAYLILDLMRIIPYTKNEEIYKFIEDAILKLTNEVEKGKFYEYINNTMRWPL